MAEHSENGKNGSEKPVLARTMGPGSIILLGIGSLLGGGVFTLLGPAAGMAGPGLFLSMILGAGVAFLNLQMYLALGTTFPEAGGGYLWVRKGLGNFQGFLAGWLSWFAHAAACGVYALSFGFYAVELLKMAGVAMPQDHGLSVKVLAFAVVMLFGYVNWRGSKITGAAGNYITVGLLGILGLFIFSGLYRMGTQPAVVIANFSPLLPHGLFGVFAATSFFYIAFEGSEIQVQAGEEAKDPSRDLKIGLLASWAVVSVLYVLISLVLIGATTAEGVPVWEALRGFGEGAIVRAAQGFMPFGAVLMTVGGLLANLAALNATIYSSSHVSFALARDNNIWTHLSRIHLKNLTPDLAVIFSTALIGMMVIFLPLFDVASAASLLFVLLFLQLNVAGINIHFKYPDTKWHYRLPWFPVMPIAAILLYIALALTMLGINAAAWTITAVWTLIGLVNYFAYALVKGREQFENRIVYEEAVRVGAKEGKRLLLPVGPSLSTEELKGLTEISLAIASEFGGEIVIVKIHEAKSVDEQVDGAVVTHDRQVFENIKTWVEEFNERTPGREKDVNFHNIILVGRNVTDVILDVIKQEECDLLILNWEGYTQTKGVVFGSKIDRILREARCDLLVIKDPRPISKVILAANPKGKNPNLALIGEIFRAITSHYAPKKELVCVMGQEMQDVPVYMKPDPRHVLEKLGLEKEDFDAVSFESARSIAKTLIERSKETDLIIVGAAKPKFLKDIRFGSIPESLAKHVHSSLFIVRGHAHMAEAFRAKIAGFFLKK